MGAKIYTNWHMSDVECNGIFSCDCDADDEDSPKRLLRLSSTNKLKQITVLRNVFSKYYVMYICIYIILSLAHILCILYIILYILYILSYQIELFCYMLIWLLLQIYRVFIMNILLYYYLL